jgi:hypothetical protein
VNAAQCREARGRRAANGVMEEENLIPQWPRALIRWGLVLIALSLGRIPAASASHLAMDLTVDGSPHPAHAGTDTMPPENGKNPRPLLHVRSGDLVKLHWSVKNTEATKLDTLLVHVFVVREAQTGQKEVPDPRKGAVWETISATALDPGKETHGVAEVPIGEPGTYLVRVESMFTQHTHEHFAAVDLVVQ